MKCANGFLRCVALSVAVILAAGCSAREQKRDFAIPKKLCGVAVPADALSRLLPSSGKRLTVDLGDTTLVGDGHALCDVAVDDHDMVLMINPERITAGDSARDILRRRLSVGQWKSAEGGAIAYADQGAVSVIKCRGDDVKEEDVTTLIRVLEPGRRDEAAMKELITAYTAELRKQGPCVKRSEAAG